MTNKDDKLPETKLTLTPGEFQALEGTINEGSLEASTIMLFKCYESIVEILKYYVDLSEEQYHLITIWIIGTYFHNEFTTYPFLFLNAMRGSGKSRLLKLINFLSSGGVGKINNNLTEAVLFRHPKNTIMCIDEIEGIGKKENGTLRELLNSAYKKGTQVQRMKKSKQDGEERQIVETFEPYFPICLANIWGLEEVLSDRALTLILEKSNNPAIVKKVEDWDSRDEIWEIKRTLSKIGVVCVVSLRKKNYITAWNSYISLKYNYTNNTNNTNNTNDTNYTNNIIIQKDKKELLEEIERDKFFNTVDDSGITGRNFELFFPLLITSKMLCEDVFLKILEISKQFVEQKREDEYSESRDISLYQFIAEHGKENEFIFIKEITEHFRLFCGDIQTTDESWCNERWVGRALKRLNLIIQKRRVREGRQVILNVQKAKEKLKMFK